MKLVKLRTTQGPIVVNMDLVTCFFPHGTGTRIGFVSGDEDYIDVTESFIDIVELFERASNGELEEDDGK